MGLTMPAQLHGARLDRVPPTGRSGVQSGLTEDPGPGRRLLIDDDEYIIAEDFEVDVPEFVHEPEWFQPLGQGDEAKGSSSNR
jgi:hypothetical protein